MGRNRLPKTRAEISGAALKHPERHKDRRAPKGTRPVGEPYAGMSAAQRRYWAEFVEGLPWLHSGHRTLLRLACMLAARMDSDEQPMGVSASQALGSILSKLGATPVDETRVNVPEDDEDDDWFARQARH